MADDHSIARTRAQAKAYGLKWYFSGEPCKNGHIGRRYVRGHNCCDCINEQTLRRYHSLSPEEKAAKNRRAYERRKEIHGEETVRREFQKWNNSWRSKNKEKVLQYSRDYHVRHRKQQLRSQMEWRKKNPQRIQELDRRSLLRKRGISENEYAMRLVAQNNCCAICKSPKPGARYRFFSIDHDHDTDVVRGLLCNSCNLGIGLFADNPDLLIAAAEYLKQWNKTTNAQRSDGVFLLLPSATDAAGTDQMLGTLSHRHSIDFG